MQNLIKSQSHSRISVTLKLQIQNDAEQIFGYTDNELEKGKDANRVYSAKCVLYTNWAQKLVIILKNP